MVIIREECFACLDQVSDYSSSEGQGSPDFSLIQFPKRRKDDCLFPIGNIA